MQSSLIIPWERGDAVTASAGTVSAGGGSLRTGEMERAITAGVSIRAGDVLSTGSSSPLLIKLKSGVSISAMQGTAFSINDGTDGDSILLNEGCVISRVPPLSGRFYEIRTPDSSVRVTGTFFGVIYKNGKTDVMVSEGSVRVTNTASGSVFDLQSPGFVESSPSMKRRGLSEKEKLLMERLISDDSVTVPDPSAINEAFSLYNDILSGISSVKRMTLDDIRVKYGQIDEVVLYSGKRYTGAIISRGVVMKIMTENGVVNVPSEQVRNIIIK
jgi:hypothetical protein